MTVGENIRRIRQERNLTQRQLGEMVGASEAYIRAYESGRRNPKPSSLEKIADALSVNPEVLANSDFDGIKAIHRLFQIFRQYDGQLFEYQDKDGNDMVGISFGTLSLMRSWLDRYEEYMEEVEKCNEIKDVKKRGEALLKAEADFNLWMDIYPESEPWQDRLKIQKAHDEAMDKMGLNPKAQK
ncbi:MAG: helix-turn-helix domain-containing protein [Roseburia sp.]